MTLRRRKIFCVRAGALDKKSGGYRGLLALRLRRSMARSVGYVAIAVIPASITVFFLKKHESIKGDSKIDFTPFKFT
jgi:hypothetical protein